MGLLTHTQLAFIFGLLGDITSFTVFLAPLPTFYTIYKKKTSEGFHSIPYVCSLTSAMLLLYYGLLKTNGILIVTINAIGCAIEVSYILFYLFYAPTKEKISTIKLLVSSAVAYGLMFAITMIVVKGADRVVAVGWICAAFSIAVFAAPLSIMRKVIMTKSVEYMPFTLSLFLSFSAVMWFLYGLLVKDMFIALPNVLGFLFGVVQMALYMLYKNAKGTEELKPEKNTETAQVKIGWQNICFCHGNDQCKEMKTIVVHDDKLTKWNENNAC